MSYVDDLRASKYVREKQLDNDICSYNFTREAFFDGVWDDQTIKARGLFCRDNDVVARSYNKFFAVDERPETQKEYLFSSLKYPVQVYRKENGFLGIVSYDYKADELFVASKSTNEGAFAGYLQNLLFNGNYDIELLKNVLRSNNISAVFEVIDIIHDPHIVEYQYSHLVLLDLIRNDFEYSKMDYHSMVAVASAIGCQPKLWVKTIYNQKEMEEFYSYMKSVKDIEGFVCEDSAGFMFKIKTDWYKYWKRIRSVIHAIAKGQTRNQVWARYRLQEEDFLLYNMMEKIIPVYITLHGCEPSVIFIRNQYCVDYLLNEFYRCR